MEKTCTHCINNGLFKSLAYLQLEVGSNFKNSSQLQLNVRPGQVSLPPAKPRVSIRSQESELESILPDLSINTGLDRMEKSTAFSDWDIRVKDSDLKIPRIPEGVLVLDRKALKDKYSCRLCKTLVAGRTYRGKQIFGFENFSQHMIDVHRKIVLVSSQSSEVGGTGVQWAESTEVILDTFDNILEKPTEAKPLGKVKSSKVGILKTKRVGVHKINKSKTSRSRNLKTGSKSRSKRHKILSRILLRKNHNPGFQTPLTKNQGTETEITMSSLSAFTISMSAVPSCNVTGSCITTVAQSDSEQRIENQIFAPKLSDQENPTMKMIDAGFTQKSPNLLLDHLKDTEDIDSDEESFIIDVGSGDDEIDHSVNPSSLILDSDIDKDNEEELNFNSSMDLEMDDENTVAVIPILIDEDPTSSESSSSLSNEMDQQNSQSTFVNEEIMPTLPIFRSSRSPTGPSFAESSSSNDRIPLEDRILYSDAIGTTMSKCTNEEPCSKEDYVSNMILESQYEIDYILKDIEDFWNEKMDQLVADVERDVKNADVEPQRGSNIKVEIVCTQESGLVNDPIKAISKMEESINMVEAITPYDFSEPKPTAFSTNPAKVEDIQTILIGTSTAHKSREPPVLDKSTRKARHRKIIQTEDIPETKTSAVTKIAVRSVKKTETAGSKAKSKGKRNNVDAKSTPNVDKEGQPKQRENLSATTSVNRTGMKRTCRQSSKQSISETNKTGSKRVPNDLPVDRKNNPTETDAKGNLVSGTTPKGRQGPKRKCKSMALNYNEASIASGK